MLRDVTLCTLGIVLLWSHGGTAVQETVEAPPASSFTSRVVATGLDFPWEVVWGPDDHLWVTERVGKRITRVNPDDGSRTVAVEIPEAYHHVMLDQPLAFVAALRAVLDGWARDPV